MSGLTVRYRGTGAVSIIQFFSPAEPDLALGKTYGLAKDSSAGPFDRWPWKGPGSLQERRWGDRLGNSRFLGSDLF
jgi:hypothetical protein